MTTHNDAAPAKTTDIVLRCIGWVVIAMGVMDLSQFLAKRIVDYLTAMSSYLQELAKLPSP